MRHLPPRVPPPVNGPPVLRPEPPGIGRTLAATIVLAVLLSVLPLPEALRPFPKLREAPKETVSRLLWPRKVVPPVQPPPPVLEALELEEEPLLSSEEMVFEPLDLTDGTPEPVRVKSAEARRWDALLKKVEGRHVPLFDPCLNSACTTTALSPWFAALEGLDANTSGPVRVVTVGTSLIASDHITDVLRRRLQERYGDAGLGFMFVDRPTRNAGRTVRSGTATEGWVIEKVTDTVPLAHAGLGGAAFTAPAGSPQDTSYLASGSRHLELFAVAQPGAGAVVVFGDGKRLGELSTAGAAGAALFPSLQLPEGVTQLTLRTRGGAVRLDGVVLERGVPGVVLDSLGLPGASAGVLLDENEALFRAQLEARQPALVILMIGGNDAFDLSLNRYSVERARERMQQLIARVKAGAPGAACLLASPPDAGVWRMDQTLTPRLQTRVVAAYMRELGERSGCAVYDMQDAMGGEGAIERWWSAGLMNRDLVHPLALGADLMGYQLDEALRGARRQHQQRTRELGSLNGGRRAPHLRPPVSLRSRAMKALSLRSGERPGEGPTVQLKSAPHPNPLSLVASPWRILRFAPAALVQRSLDRLRSGPAGAGRGREGRNPTPDLRASAGDLPSSLRDTPDAGIELAICPLPSETPQPSSPPLECTPRGADGGIPQPSFLRNPEALARFFERLRVLETEGMGRVAIMQLGASHTAAHTFTDEGRRLLTARFGSAGRGFVGAGQPSPRLERSGVTRSLFGHWAITDALKQRSTGTIWGLTGVRAVAKPGASLTMSFDEALGTFDDTARIQVYYQEEPGLPPPEVIIDGLLVPMELEPSVRTGVRVLQFAAPGHQHVVSLSNPGPGPLTFFGVSQELVRPGIVYDSLGLPGSTASTLASYEQNALFEQVQARQPDLFVFFYGTNESSLPKSRIEEMRLSYPLLFHTLRQASPQADCLILGPTDRMVWKRGQKGWKEAESIDSVITAMQQVAAEQGCAFWQTREAMGGKGSIDRWRKQKLGHKDHVHLTTEGYQRLAGLTIGELIRAYDAWKAGQ